MTVSKDDIAKAMRDAQQEAERLASSLPESAWSRQAYEQGWNAKQMLCHLVDSTGVVSFLISFAKEPRPLPAGDGGGFDIDKWNAQQVAMREDKSIQDLLTELRANIGREVEAVEAAPDDLLAGQMRAPWGAEGTLGDLIMGTISEHFHMHLAHLRAAAA